MRGGSRLRLQLSRSSASGQRAPLAGSGAVSGRGLALVRAKRRVLLTICCACLPMQDAVTAEVTPPAGCRLALQGAERHQRACGQAGAAAYCRHHSPANQAPEYAAQRERITQRARLGRVLKHGALLGCGELGAAGEVAAQRARRICLQRALRAVCLLPASNAAAARSTAIQAAETATNQPRVSPPASLGPLRDNLQPGCGRTCS